MSTCPDLPGAGVASAGWRRHPDHGRVWQPAERGAERFAEIHAYLHKEGWSDPLAKKDGSLEECSAPELAAMNAVAGDFSESYIGSALKIETIQQLIENENAHVDWREGFWGRPPAWLAHG